MFLCSYFSVFYVSLPGAAAVTNCGSYHPFLATKLIYKQKNNQTMPLIYKEAEKVNTMDI